MYYRPPGKNPVLTYTNLDPQPTLTRYEVSIAAKSLLKGLMGKDPSTRISSIKALQESHWLANQDWDALRVGDRATTPPFVPNNALTTPASPTDLPAGLDYTLYSYLRPPRLPSRNRRPARSAAPSPSTM